MFKRIVLAAALVVAPLVLTPTSVDAQERGMEQASAATANAQATGRPDAAPQGLQNRPGEELPPGIALTRETESEGDTAGDDGGGEECLDFWLNPETGLWEPKPCDGT